MYSELNSRAKSTVSFGVFIVQFEDIQQNISQLTFTC